MKRLLTRSWPPVLLVVLGVVAYAGSLRGVFVFDDYAGIVDNPAIRDLAGSILLSSRPLTGLSFHLNYHHGVVRLVIDFESLSSGNPQSKLFLGFHTPS